LFTYQFLTIGPTHHLFISLLVRLLIHRSSIMNLIYHFSKTDGPSEVLIKQINITIIVHLRITRSTLLSITYRLFINIKVWCLSLNIFCFNVSYL
jgi:hypothetical protein